MQGDPQTMQQDPRYENVTLEVFDALNARLHELHAAGIYDVIIDPGFGFGKTAEHNFRLLRELSFFRQLGCPVMAGLSRKGTIWKTLGIQPEEALNGTTVMHTLALLNGADLLRVHDVKEAMEVIKLLEQYQKSKEPAS
jgi:dihydropteroate synthase